MPSKGPAKSVIGLAFVYSKSKRASSRLDSYLPLHPHFTRRIHSYLFKHQFASRTLRSSNPSLLIIVAMAGGKGKSVGGKATGAKDSGTKTQKSHSAKAGLQVS